MYIVKIGVLHLADAKELEGLLSYRNEIAHEIHGIMVNVSRISSGGGGCNFAVPKYESDALWRLRKLRTKLMDRAGRRLIISLNFNDAAFEFDEKIYIDELRRLNFNITRQIEIERNRRAMITAELDVSGTELVGDLAPRFPANHRSARYYGDEWRPPTGHLTERGVETCYRLFDLGKTSIAVAYLMGITQRSAERRKASWAKKGGKKRKKITVERYDLKTGQKGQ